MVDNSSSATNAAITEDDDIIDPANVVYPPPEVRSYVYRYIPTIFPSKFPSFLNPSFVQG